MLIEIKKIASAGVYDLLLIEGTGISEPLQVAETFTFEDDAGLSLSKYAALDTMITMVDAVHFFDYVHSEKTVQDEKSALDENDLRTLSDLLVGQVEFANVILISKCDLVSDAATVGEIEAFVRALNPNALVLRKGKDDRIDLRNVLFTKRFNFEEAAMNPGWMKGKLFFGGVIVGNANQHFSFSRCPSCPRVGRIWSHEFHLSSKTSISSFAIERASDTNTTSAKLSSKQRNMLDCKSS